MRSSGIGVLSTSEPGPTCKFATTKAPGWLLTGSSQVVHSAWAAIPKMLNLMLHSEGPLAWEPCRLLRPAGPARRARLAGLGLSLVALPHADLADRRYP